MLQKYIALMLTLQAAGMAAVCYWLFTGQPTLSVQYGAKMAWADVEIANTQTSLSRIEDDLKKR